MRVRIRSRALGRLALAVTLLAVATAGALDAQQVKTPPGLRIVEVPITGNVYNDGKPVEVTEGDAVVWVNNDRMPHSASRYTEEGTYIDQPFNTGFIAPGQKSNPIVLLKATGTTGLEYKCDVHGDEHNTWMKPGFLVVRPRTVEHPAPSPGTVYHHPPSPEGPLPMSAEHSMVTSGASGAALFLHHYSLFNNPYHEYHVTLEGRLDDCPRRLYEAYREKFPAARVMMDTKDLHLLQNIVKEGAGVAVRFSHGGDLEDLVPAVGPRPCRPKGTKQAAKATQWGWVIPGLDNVVLTIGRVIRFRHYDPEDRYPSSLVYQLYGNNSEVFMAHEVTARPSFLHVVQLAEIPSFLTPDLIRKSPLVSIPSKQLREGQPLARSVRTAVLNDNTHFLLSPPTGSLNPEPPLQDDEVITVLIEGDPTPAVRKQLKVARTIFFDPRIINR
jgi:plastocyanin